MVAVGITVQRTDIGNERDGELVQHVQFGSTRTLSAIFHNDANVEARSGIGFILQWPSRTRAN